MLSDMTLSAEEARYKTVDIFTGKLSAKLRLGRLKRLPCHLLVPRRVTSIRPLHRETLTVSHIPSRSCRAESDLTRESLQITPRRGTCAPKISQRNTSKLLITAIALDPYNMTENLRVLLVGNGGREHAIAWKLLQSPSIAHIYVVPGNGGTATLSSKVANVSSVKETDFAGLVKFAKEKDVNLLIPGPEAPLVAGIVDYFTEHGPKGIRAFGPSKAAATMEGSKTFSKDFMKRHSIPTAAYENFSQYEDAKKYLDTISHNVVIKASGLAAGKGVIIPTSKEEAQAALKDIMLDREFGTAGDEVVIEEFLEGDELSILSFSDGKTIKSLPPAQDHKRIFDNDEGPNTGGMGTYAPTRIAPRDVLEKVDKDILQPTIDGMRSEGMEFKGVLFTGLMMTKNGPKVLEYNVRFGDPETQSLLALMEGDLAEVMVACAEGKLSGVDVKVSERSAATVVVAAGGYPGSYAKGTPMTLDAVPEGKHFPFLSFRDLGWNADNVIDVVLFHAGTSFSDNTLKTSGGRVIASTATAPTLEEAVAKAYKGVECIHFEGMQYRKDIAGRALKK
jgi:phosphoribosylamine--glycine ligase